MILSWRIKEHPPFHNFLTMFLGFIVLAMMIHTHPEHVGSLPQITRIHYEDSAPSGDDHLCPACYIADSGAEDPIALTKNSLYNPVKQLIPAVLTQNHLSKPLTSYKHQRAPPV